MGDGAMFYFGSCLGLLADQSSVVIRSLLSKVTHQDEIGKVYSLLSSLEAAVPLAAAPLFSEIYNNTMETFIGAVYVVEAGIVGLSGIVFLYVYYLLRNFSQSSVILE